MTKVIHEHKEFIDTIIDKVNAHSRLVSMDQGTRDWHGEYRKEALVLVQDIENSLYRRLDEVGDQ
mgnify:FL=1